MSVGKQRKKIWFDIKQYDKGEIWKKKKKKGWNFHLEEARKLSSEALVYLHSLWWKAYAENVNLVTNLCTVEVWHFPTCLIEKFSYIIALCIINNYYYLFLFILFI